MTLASRSGLIAERRRSGPLAAAAEQLLVLALFTLVSLALTWPAPRAFTGALYGYGADPLHNLWLIWHTREALLLRQPLFEAPLLYYPQGITLLTHGLGPVMGLLALPFWPLGPVAAHNGAVLAGLTLTGYCMYLLVRGLGLRRDVALFGGLALVTAPICLAGLGGHMTKVFLGGPPLALLALHRALDPARPALRWSVGLGLAMLLLLLHSGYQFVFTAVAVALLAGATLLAAPRGRRLAVAGRIALAALCIALLAGPLLAATFVAGADPALNTDSRAEAAAFRLDALLFLLPAVGTRLAGLLPAPLDALGAAPPIEQSVGLSWLCLLLAGAALIARAPGARRWAALAAACCLLALGPALTLAGRTAPFPLPFAWLMDLPGFGSLRIPSRFMMVGFVALAVAASLGLEALGARWPRRRPALLAAAVALLLLERWPQPVRLLPLPQAPAFYAQIAADAEPYGVLDLPFMPLDRPSSFSVGAAPFQVFQITHGKGIAGGYVSRVYREPPRFPEAYAYRHRRAPQDISLDGVPFDGPADTRARLVLDGYRYVVWHKGLYPSADAAARGFVGELFGAAAPLADDARAAVYALDQSEDLLVRYGAGWGPREEGAWRWAGAEGRLELVSGRARRLELQLTPALLYSPDEPGGLGAAGEIEVRVGDGPPARVPVTVDHMAAVPIVLPAGASTVTLRLRAGSFHPADYGGADQRELSFALRGINLVSAP